VGSSCNPPRPGRHFHRPRRSKLVGIWGGPGLQTTIEAFERFLGVPSYLTLIVVGTEFFGGLTALIGFLTRIAAGLAADMVAAIIKVHLMNGFFLNWSITPGKGHGYEFNLALLAMSIALLLSGPGKFAFDRMLDIEQE
jgi:putative oxidoreductase